LCPVVSLLLLHLAAISFFRPYVVRFDVGSTTLLSVINSSSRRWSDSL